MVTGLDLVMTGSNVRTTPQHAEFFEVFHGDVFFLDPVHVDEFILKPDFVQHVE